MPHETIATRVEARITLGKCRQGVYDMILQPQKEDEVSSGGPDLVTAKLNDRTTQAISMRRFCGSC